VSSPDLPKIAPTGRRLWQCKVDVLLEQLRKSSQQYRMPSTHISLDECMMRANGQSPDTYKMPSKPIEQGFKFHCLADHCYIWDIHSTSNQAGPDPVPSTDGLNATGEVVYHLLRKLSGIMYWIVYLDNFYTTVPLLGRLRHQQKNIPYGRNGFVRVDTLCHSRQSHPGGGLLRTWCQCNASRCISRFDRCFTVSSRSVGLLFSTSTVALWPTVTIRRNGFIGYALASGLPCDGRRSKYLSSRSFYLRAKCNSLY
jgi:hypothetical protein